MQQRCNNNYKQLKQKTMSKARNDRVKELLKTLKITEMQLARMIDKPQSTIYRITSGEVNPNKSTLELIAQKTKFSADWLIDGIGEKMQKDIIDESSLLQKALNKLTEQLDKKDFQLAEQTVIISTLSKLVSSNFPNTLNLTGLDKRLLREAA